jgi:hypothetical protein
MGRIGEAMSCYLRQMRSLFDTLGLEYDKANRARVDAAIRETLGMGEGVHCPEVWSAIKALPPQRFADLPGQVAERLG